MPYHRPEATKALLDNPPKTQLSIEFILPRLETVDARSPPELDGGRGGGGTAPQPDGPTGSGGGYEYAPGKGGGIG